MRGWRAVARRNGDGEKTVLVGVLKNRRDRGILFRERWYRIPMAFVPTRAFRYLAFYQPASFGRDGKRIQYYARVLTSRVRPRRNLLTRELHHPRAGALYRQIRVGKIWRLPRPIRNVLPRRVSFGFTTLRRLRRTTNILELYGVVPTEQIVGRSLQQLGDPSGAAALRLLRESALPSRFCDCLSARIACSRV